jgi:hypothetical protein
MLGKKDETKSINFLQPVGASDTVVVTSVNWLATVGKYFLTVTLIIVLGAFVFRFIKDQQNNDLTKEINDRVKVLENDTWKQNTIKYERLQALLGDIETVQEEQDLNSNLIAEIINGIPLTLNVESISINKGRVSISLKTIDFTALKNYEESLKNNTYYGDVRFDVKLTGDEWEVSLSFSVVEEVEE